MKTFLTIILLSCFVSVRSQPETDLNADLLSIEYNIWKTEDKDSAIDLIVMKAEKLNKNGYFSDAITELNRIDTNICTNLNEVKYLKSLNTFLNSDFEDSYNKMLEINDSVRLSNKIYLNLWLFILNENKMWDECKRLMLSVCDTSSMIFSDIYKLPVTTEFLSPLKASRLSTILPGLGQVYAGYTFRGISSFILVTGFATVAVISAISGLYVTGVVYGLIPVFRFYTGGRQYSYRLADKQNEEQILELKKDYLNNIILLELKN